MCIYHRMGSILWIENKQALKSIKIPKRSNEKYFHHIKRQNLIMKSMLGGKAQGKKKEQKDDNRNTDWRTTSRD